MANDQMPEVPDVLIDNLPFCLTQVTGSSIVFFSEIIPFRSHPADLFSFSQLTTE